MGLPLAGEGAQQGARGFLWSGSEMSFGRIWRVTITAVRLLSMVDEGEEGHLVLAERAESPQQFLLYVQETSGSRDWVWAPRSRTRWCVGEGRPRWSAGGRAGLG